MCISLLCLQAPGSSTIRLASYTIPMEGGRRFQNYTAALLQTIVTGKRQCLCDMHSSMSVGFLMHLFMNDFLPGCLFAVVVT